MSIQAISFIPFGLGSVLCNAILILAVLRSTDLRTRREIRIITALSFAEFVEGELSIDFFKQLIALQ